MSQIFPTYSHTNGHEFIYHLSICILKRRRCTLGKAQALSRYQAGS